MINVPLAQSFRFRPVNADPANFDNTFASETEGAPYSFDIFAPEEDILLQVVRNDLDTFDTFVKLIHNNTVEYIVSPAETVLGGLKYQTYTLPLATYPGECCYIEVYEDVVLMFKSEEFTVEDKSSYLKIEWFNSENSFQMDYSSGLTHIIQLEAKKWKLNFGGEASVYVNQGQEVKLKEIVQRIFLLECEVPDYLAELLVLAMAHDRFYINSVEFVVSKKPTLSQIGTSGMYSFSAEVKQKTIIGLNTHDVG